MRKVGSGCGGLWGVVGNESAYYVYRVSEKAYIEEYELLEKDFVRIREFGFNWEVGSGPAATEGDFEQDIEQDY